MPDSPCTLLLPKTNSRRRGAKRPDLAKIKGVIASSRKKNTWRQTKFGTYRNKFTYIHTVHYITLHCITLHYITLYYIILHYIALHTYNYIYMYDYIYIMKQDQNYLYQINKNDGSC